MLDLKKSNELQVLKINTNRSAISVRRFRRFVAPTSRARLHGIRSERKGDEIADLRRDLACTTLRLHEMKVKYEASSEAAAKHLGERQTRESDRLEELLSSSRRHASDPSTLCMLNSYADRLQVLDHEYALAEEKIEALTAELEAGAVASKKAREALESAHTL